MRDTRLRPAHKISSTGSNLNDHSRGRSPTFPSPPWHGRPDRLLFNNLRYLIAQEQCSGVNGNIRELEKVIEGAVILSQGGAFFELQQSVTIPPQQEFTGTLVLPDLKTERTAKSATHSSQQLERSLRVRRPIRRLPTLNRHGNGS